MKRYFRVLNHYILFFLIIAFLTTGCIILFTKTLINSLGLVLTGENLQAAAELTFIHILVLSFLATAFDAFRRKITVERTARQITRAAKKIVAGEFDVRIPSLGIIGYDDCFHEIVECFNKMAQELSSVEMLRTDFISNVSHELKTPLAAMHNYGTLLQAPDLSEDMRIKYARSITDNSRRLADMMTNILKLNKLENQQIFPNTEKFNLGEQLCESLLQFENIWEQEDIEIETDIAEDIHVYADKELLFLVWNNLLSNAFKFTSRGGTVSLSLTATDTHATIKVKDTGCGMSPETGAHIFEKFYQGDTSHATHGNGLGLSLVKRIVEILHGEIGVESTLGKGSTFTVKIRRT